MKQLLLVLFLTLTPAAYLTAATVKGWVKDAQTGEELIGAAVYVKENPAMGTTAGLDGTFVLKDVPEGKNITLVCSYISYETQEQNVNTLSGRDVLFNMKPSAMNLEGVTIIAANPGTLDVEKLKCYRKSGFNRISIGCQSVHDEELKRLGRIHTFAEFQESFALARDAGFANINVDLMSGLPEQSEEKWEESLRTIAELSPEHISAYSLIVEPGTPFAEQKLDLPDEDTEREMYARTAEILAEYGFFQYEISNYAKPGFACRHNIGYWKRTDYLGFGPSAASLFGNRRWTNTADRSLYLKACGALEKIREDEEILSRQDAMEEFMFLGLRMTQGISTAEFEEKFGKEIHAVYGGVLKKYEAMHLLQEHSGRLALTRNGISVSNVILADFLL